MIVKKLLNNFILVEDPYIEGNEREMGGIVIPADMGEHLVDGHWVKCFMVGPDCVDVKAGDTVFLPRLSGYPYEHKGKRCLITREADIICKQVD